MPISESPFLEGKTYSKQDVRYQKIYDVNNPSVECAVWNIEIKIKKAQNSMKELFFLGLA